MPWPGGGLDKEIFLVKSRIFEAFFILLLLITLPLVNSIVLQEIQLRQAKAAKVVGRMFFDIFDAFQHTISLPAW